VTPSEYEQVSAESALMKQLLVFIADQLDEAINRCKNAGLNKEGTKDERLVNVAGFSVELKDKIIKEKQKLLQKGQQ